MVSSCQQSPEKCGVFPDNNHFSMTRPVCSCPENLLNNFVVVCLGEESTSCIKFQVPTFTIPSIMISILRKPEPNLTVKHQPMKKKVLSEIHRCIRTLIILSPRVQLWRLDGELIRARVTLIQRGTSCRRRRGQRKILFGI